MTQRYHFDVVIVGGGFGGLKCAHILAKSNMKVLLIEKKKKFGHKVCAGGITPEDLKYIPKYLLNFPFKKLIFSYKDKKIFFPIEDTIISSIERTSVANVYVDQLKKSKNISIWTGIKVRKIISNNSLQLEDNQIIDFSYLVGADGSTSLVRKFLNLPKEKLSITVQYKIPYEFDSFEIHFHNKFFGNGYLWIFPHKGYSFIGCISDKKYIPGALLKKNLFIWMKRKNINFDQGKLESFIINSDYRGYKFGNIFLVGDAAGLASGSTGKGIYPAFLSGEQVGKEILGLHDKNLIYGWLKKKKEQELFLVFLKNPWIRSIFYPIMTRLILNKKFNHKMKLLLG